MRVLRLVLCVSVLLYSAAPSAPSAQETCGIKELGKCPVFGCSAENSDHGLMNTFKRRTGPEPGAELHKLSFDDIHALQDAADTLHFPHGRGTDLTHAQRDLLATAGATGVGEGSFVQVVGFISDDEKNPRANTGESVNCGLTTQKNNDFHINLVEDEDESEFEGFVSEMVPLDRSDGWTLKKLRLVRKGGRKVLVRGLLFYDNVHDVRTDPDADANGNPPRFALWEVHPITDFRVCMRKDNKCSADNLNTWRKLDAVSLAALKPFQSK